MVESSWNSLLTFLYVNWDTLFTAAICPWRFSFFSTLSFRSANLTTEFNHIAGYFVLPIALNHDCLLLHRVGLIPVLLELLDCCFSTVYTLNCRNVEYDHTLNCCLKFGSNLNGGSRCLLIS